MKAAELKIGDVVRTKEKYTPNGLIPSIKGKISKITEFMVEVKFLDRWENTCYISVDIDNIETVS